MSPPHTRVLSACHPPTDSATAAKAQARVPARPPPGSTHMPTPTPPPEATFASSDPHQDPSHAVPMCVLNTATSIHISPAVTGLHSVPTAAKMRLQDGHQALRGLPCAHGRPISSRPTPPPAVQVHGDPVPRDWPRGCRQDARPALASPGHPSEGGLVLAPCPEAPCEARLLQHNS